MSDMSDKPAIVVGASRGLGHGIALALADEGAPVIAVSRTPAAFPGGIRPELADAAEEDTAARLIERDEPQVVVVVAGATPHMQPLHEQTWETFSVNWETDVRIAFHWLRAALREPLRPGSKVVVFSSGAALNGSPLSGGYAGAKATQRFMTRYAQDESDRAGLGITFTSVLPRFAPETGVGGAGVAAYAAQSGLSPEDYLATQQYELLTPEAAGTAIVGLVRSDAAAVAPAYVLTGAGLEPM